MMSALTKDQIARVQILYAEMPGAPMPHTEYGERMWGDVENNGHWRFCAMIVRMVDDAEAHAADCRGDKCDV